jgi:hypothetical protein
MTIAIHEVADILKQHWTSVIENGKLNTWQLRILNAVKDCRTAALGAHVDGCTQCGYLRISYNSCRNRHCPKCQGIQREDWIQKRESELLPVPYFHLVFTLPDTLNQLCLYQGKILYNLFFKTAWSVLSSFGKDHKWLGADMGMIAVLHTWGQTMSLHPHLHCIVPGGGLTRQRKWKTVRSKGKYLFPVKAVSKVFRSRFIEELKKVLPDEMNRQVVATLYKKDWVIYAKRPFSGPQSVIEYLGRYTHKIAISNHRIKNISKDKITFSYKDYRKNGLKREMELEPLVFIHRYALHILPKGFVRIRHYGILSSRSKLKCRIEISKQIISCDAINTKQHHQLFNPKECPCCKRETLRTIMCFNRRAPPENWAELATIILNSYQPSH